MKKYLIISAALLLAASCTQKGLNIEESTVEIVPADVPVTHILASGENSTKASLDGTSGAFTWNTGDKVAVYADGYKVSDALASDYNNTNDATFSFSGAQSFDDADRANFAVSPASLVYDSSNNLYTSDVTASSLKINLPRVYNLSDTKDNKAPLPMIATNAPEGNLAFKTLGALLRFTLVSVPKQTQYITFDFNGKKVCGEFTLTGVTPGTTAIYTSATDGGDDIITVYNDDVFSTFQTSLVVNVPVPAGVASTGEYTDVTVITWDGEPGNGGHKINALTAPIKNSANWVPDRHVARKKTMELPVFTIASGVRAVFAPGNLQAVLGKKVEYNKPGYASAWHFAEQQYIAIGATIPEGKTYSSNSFENKLVGEKVDLFAWVGDDATAYNEGDFADEKYKYGLIYASNDNSFRGNTGTDNYLLRDWGQNEIDGYPANTWRTPTQNEWYQVVLNRSSCDYFRATITDVTPVAYGLVIVPDQFTRPSGIGDFSDKNTPGSHCSSNQFTYAQWKKLEAAGCVFFPLTNRRNKNSTTNKGQTVFPGDGVYWCQGPSGTTKGNTRYFGFSDTEVGSVNATIFGDGTTANTTIRYNKTIGRFNGCAVRLVRVVN